ncbi:hypothetical protein [Streptomyces sp. NPDC058092]|uniref:hypothetical protein n=1 Tax=Streptomyces sp. NPDC058092 TaxID=3346336 RepID=UPI0036EC9994
MDDDAFLTVALQVVAGRPLGQYVGVVTQGVEGYELVGDVIGVIRVEVFVAALGPPAAYDVEVGEVPDPDVSAGELEDLLPQPAGGLFLVDAGQFPASFVQVTDSVFAALLREGVVGDALQFLDGAGPDPERAVTVDHVADVLDLLGAGAFDLFLRDGLDEGDEGAALDAGAHPYREASDDVLQV